MGTVIPKVQPAVQLRAIPTNTTQAVQERGLGQMGQNLGQVAQTLDSVDARLQREREKLELAEVMKRESDFARQAASLEIQFRQLQGRNAFEKTAGYRALLDNTRSAIAGEIKDERLRGIFMQRTENRRNGTAEFYERHVAGEGQRLADDADKSYEQTAQGDAARLWDDPARFEGVVKEATEAFTAREAVLGRDPEVAKKNVEARVQALYVQRMNAALKGQDAVKAREVFEQSKAGLGGAAEAAEEKVRQMELPAQAASYAAAVFDVAGKNAEDARALVDDMADSDPRKPLVQDDVEKRIRLHDDDMRRKWAGAGGWLQNLSSLRFNGAKLTDPRITSILQEATDPSSPYADEARAWYQRELDRSRALQDRARSLKNEEEERANKILLPALAAIDTVDRQIDPRRTGGSAAETQFWWALQHASPDMVLKAQAAQNEKSKLRDGGGAIDFEKTKGDLKEEALNSGFGKDTLPHLMVAYEEWYKRTVNENQGNPPTVKQLSEFRAKNLNVLEVEKFGRNPTKPAYMNPSGETTPAPREKQPAVVQQAQRAEELKNLRAKMFERTAADARAKVVADARNSPEGKAKLALVDEFGQRGLAAIAQNPTLSAAELRKRLVAVQMDALTITGN